MFKKFYDHHYAQYETLRPIALPSSGRSHDLTSLSRNARQVQRRHQDQSELTQYLTSRPSTEDDPLKAWSAESQEYPALGIMARDILAVPISGVGVERCFNMARDVCHYRRGHLSAVTIRKVMMIKHRRRTHLQPEYESMEIQASQRDDGGEEDATQDADCETLEVENFETVDGIEELSEDNVRCHDFVDIYDPGN